MKTAERDAFHLALKELVGEVAHSYVMFGGDLCVFPNSIDQQKTLLSTYQLTDRNFTCSLPSSSASKSKGVIFDVPVDDKEEDILAALSNQNVIAVKRLPMKGHPEIPSTTVLLSFSSTLPDRVNMAALMYKVRLSIPNPFRCNKCWRLGHSSSRCSSSLDKCKKCGSHHAPDFLCITKCVNCSSPSHESDSADCPEFLELKAILKFATLNGISVQEARSKHKSLYSQATLRAKRSLPHSDPSNSNLNTPDPLSSQISSLQDEIKQMREITLPGLNASIAALTKDLDNTKKKVANFDQRFDNFAIKQDSRFDSIEFLLQQLTAAISPLTSSHSPSFITGKNVNPNPALPTPSSNHRPIVPMTNPSLSSVNDYSSENHLALSNNMSND
jgi:hypothetical protein